MQREFTLPSEESTMWKTAKLLEDIGEGSDSDWQSSSTYSEDDLITDDECPNDKVDEASKRKYRFTHRHTCFGVSSSISMYLYTYMNIDTCISVSLSF